MLVTFALPAHRKGLVQFALTGGRDLEQYAILLVRVSTGLFFAISGANKLFCRWRHETRLRYALTAKFPFPLPDGLFRGGCRVRLRILADRGVSFEPGLRRVIDSEHQAVESGNLLNRCRRWNSCHGFESPLSVRFPPIFFSIAVPE